MDQAPNNSDPDLTTLIVTQWVDARGLLCPQPLLLARQAISEVAVGEIVAVRATDPHSELDFEVFSIRTGHKLLEQRYDGEEWVFFLQRADNAD